MRQLKNIDLALLPTGNKYTMDSAEAAEAALAINPKKVMAMHDGEKIARDSKRKLKPTRELK
jgi:L-ascorbate metabolism protein UlaG (beta-lactamase superfamily)